MAEQEILTADQKAAVDAAIKTALAEAEEPAEDVEAEPEGEARLDMTPSDLGRIVAETVKALRADEKRTGVNFKKVTKLGFADDEMESFKHWLRTGDAVAYKAAMQGQTDTEGGYAVPDDFYNSIVAKRDELSVFRAAGATVINGSLDRILVPVEGTSATAAVRTAEEAAVDQNEPNIDQVAITAHKMTKLVKISDELVADEKAGLVDVFLPNVFARSFAAMENSYFTTGTGTNQPKGVFASSTLGVTAAGTNALTAANIIDLEFALDSPYLEDGRVGWLMRRATEGKLRALTGNPFAFDATPQGSSQGRQLRGYPVYTSVAVAALATASKVVGFLNFGFYFIYQRQGLTIRRLNELYAGTGQIGFLATARVGGQLTQAEAAQHILTS